MSCLPLDELRPIQILDAATGAGNTTLEMARALHESGLNGKIISIDVDPECWSGWAKPKLDEERLTGLVEFHVCDLRELSRLGLKYDGIFCSTTLSIMGLDAIEAVEVWKDVLHSNGCISIYDYLPQSAPRTSDEKLSSFAWQLNKAADALSGRLLCDEFAPEFWSRLLTEQGFAVEKVLTDTERPYRSQESLDEFLSTSLDLNCVSDEVRIALNKAYEEVKQEIARRGRMTRLSGTFLLMARRAS
jgi:ubiquinone/menaquinone biosynthesis C-methylase UbiE